MQLGGDDHLLKRGGESVVERGILRRDLALVERILRRDPRRTPVLHRGIALRQHHIGDGMIRLKLNRLTQLTKRLDVFTALEVQRSEVAMRIGRLRPESDRLFVVADGGLIVLLTVRRRSVDSDGGTQCSHLPRRQCRPPSSSPGRDHAMRRRLRDRFSRDPASAVSAVQIDCYSSRRHVW